MVITIDGLSTNGKTTIAGILSKRYGYSNFNSGLFYRIAAAKLLKEHTQIEDERAVLNVLHNMDYIVNSDGSVILDGEDVTKFLYGEEISYYSTEYAIYPYVKGYIKELQDMALSRGNVIMEGRDIATRIAPNADVKFYLYSDFPTRAFRYCTKNPDEPIVDAIKNLMSIDEIDERVNSVVPRDAIAIDTTHLTIDEVVDKMVVYIDEKKDLDKSSIKGVR